LTESAPGKAAVNRFPFFFSYSEKIVRPQLVIPPYADNFFGTLPGVLEVSRLFIKGRVYEKGIVYYYSCGFAQFLPQPCFEMDRYTCRKDAFGGHDRG
jgi:hypothetical protein